MPPALSRMFTPAIDFDTPSSRAVTWRVQPPLDCLTWASANENLRLGNVPESVAGGFRRSGFWASRTTSPRERIRAADAWSPAGLRRRFRGLSRRGGDHGAGGHRSRKNIPAREFAHSILPCEGVTLRSPSARVRQPVPAFLFPRFACPRPRSIKRDGKETSTILVPRRVHFPRDA